jgi:hypothetical protein
MLDVGVPDTMEAMSASLCTLCLPKIHPRRSHGVSMLGRDCRCQKPTVVL